MKKFLKVFVITILIFSLYLISNFYFKKVVNSWSVNLTFKLNTTYFELNGERFNFSNEPIVKNGRVFVPIRDFLKAFEIDYLWVNSDRSINFEFDRGNVKIFVDKDFYVFNKTNKNYFLNPFIYKNLTYLSIRDISEIFGFKLLWIDKEKKIYLSGNIYPKVVVKDDLNNFVTFYRKPKRIVSLAPSNTEILFSLGLDNEIVGVTEFCNYPEEAKKKEKIGGFSNPNLEKIYSLKPDFVFGIRGNPIDIFTNLKKLKINSLAFDPKNLEDLFDLILKIGKIVDKREEAKNLVKHLKERRDKLVEEAKKLKKRKVYVELWNSPYISVGKNTYLNSMIKEIGGINIAENAIGDWPILSQEYIINENPEVIIITYMGQNIDDILKRPGWENIDAVKNRRVYIFENEDLLFRLGPRIIDGMEELFKLIHKDELSNYLNKNEISLNIGGEKISSYLNL
jgi:iron complex transport system substrate-binding protein